MDTRPLDSFDALLVLSFGGPEGHDDVRPFLENVTRGRGIPPERLDDVEVHYHHFGGRSPINDLNREIIANVEQVLKQRNIDLPVYFGNRNWKPFDTEVTEEMARDGVRNALVLATSAWGGYSGCKQYQEDIQRVRSHLKSTGGPDIRMTKIRQFYDHPKFIHAVADSIRNSFAELPDALRDDARLVFTAHSIPLTVDPQTGIPRDASLYSSQVAEASKMVAQELGITDYDVVWQSRSGDPRRPWLEPDIVDHAEALHSAGVKAIVAAPIGFISDHMEVIWDLDSELMDEAKKWGMTVNRAQTVGPTPEFATMIVDLIEELTAGLPEQRLGELPSRGSSVNGEECGPQCCGSPQRRPSNISRENPNAETAKAMNL